GVGGLGGAIGGRPLGFGVTTTTTLGGGISPYGSDLYGGGPLGGNLYGGNLYGTNLYGRPSSNKPGYDFATTFGSGHQYGRSSYGR
ncbi:unnamed protein product, partial [Rotaria sordida]